MYRDRYMGRYGYSINEPCHFHKGLSVDSCNIPHLVWSPVMITRCVIQRKSIQNPKPGHWRNLKGIQLQLHSTDYSRACLVTIHMSKLILET